MVLESADPEYFVPHVDLTQVAQYTAEAAEAGGPQDASLGMLWRKLSDLPAAVTEPLSSTSLRTSSASLQPTLMLSYYSSREMS
jgi:hypothetical protein